MRLKISELKPNPFKKEINKGKLNPKIIEKIKGNIKELGLMGSLPIFKKDNKYFLIAGHHRIEALKQTFGSNHEIEVTLHNYSDENILRGMVVENLTQRSDELVEVTENLSAIRNFLRSRSPVEQPLKTQGKRTDLPYETGTVREIYSWLNKNGEVMSIGKISEYLKVYDNLDRRLLKKTIKTSGGVIEEETISVTDAITLSKLDKKEQPLMKKILDKTGLDKDGKRKLITKYLEAPEEIKDKIKKEEIDIREIEQETNRFNIEQAKKLKDKQLKVKSIKQQINSQINYLKFSLLDSKDNIRQSFNYLSILSKYMNDMDDKQKEKLNVILERYEDLFKKVSNLISQVKEKIW